MHNYYPLRGVFHKSLIAREEWNVEWPTIVYYGSHKSLYMLRRNCFWILWCCTPINTKVLPHSKTRFDDDKKVKTRFRKVSNHYRHPGDKESTNDDHNSCIYSHILLFMFRITRGAKLLGYNHVEERLYNCLNYVHTGLLMSKTASARFYRSSKNKVSFRHGVMNLINFWQWLEWKF